MQISETPLTPKQRRELAGPIAPAITALRVSLFVLVVAGTGAVLRGIQAAMGQAGNGPWWLIPTTLLAAWLYVRGGRWTGGPQLRAKLRADLAGGVARVTRFETRSVIKIEQHADEGPTYFVRTEDGQTVMLFGQHMDARRNHRFPWRAFEIVEAPRSRLFFELRRCGDPIPADAVHPQLPLELTRLLEGDAHTYALLDESAQAALDQHLRP